MCRISEEKDPVLREIWSAGYTRIQEDIVNDKIVLFNDHDKTLKIIDLFKFKMCIASLNFKKGSNMAGSTHTWIQESDGSAERFRTLIN